LAEDRILVGDLTQSRLGGEDAGTYRTRREDEITTTIEIKRTEKRKGK
jgi:hypothetical protein